MNQGSDSQKPTSLLAWVQDHSAKRSKSSSVDTSLTVTGLSKMGDPSVLGRLGDLGIATGEVIEYFGTAPLGEPIMICVRDTVIALRWTEAELVSVNEVALS